MGFIYRLKVSLLLVLYSVLDLFKNVFHLRKKCFSSVRLEGKVVVITGGNDGIGKETALQLSLRDAKVIIGCRDLEKGQSAVRDIQQKNPKANIRVLKLDLSSLKSVRQFAKEVKGIESKIDILINNAGVMACPESQTEDGFEMHFGVNHLGHFLLTLSLLPLLRGAEKARVVTVSSLYHIAGEIHFENINLKNVYKWRTAYAQSKLANVLFTRELALRLGPQSNIRTYSLHPGIINSNLWRHQPSAFKKFLQNHLYLGVEMGAQTTLYCALEESIEKETGFYYDDCKPIEEKSMVRNAIDNERAKQLWELSSDLVKLEDNLKLDPHMTRT